jgi:hypothetical protein
MRFSIVSVAWCGAVVWFWQNCVPVLPTSEIRPQLATWQVGYSQTGKFVFCGRMIDEDGRVQMAGPIQFWDPSTGTLVRESLAPDDQILELSLSERDVAVTLRDGYLRAIDLENSRLLFERPVASPIQKVSVSLDQKLLSIVESSSLTICDLVAGRELWSKQDVTFDRFDDSGCVVARGRRSHVGLGRPTFVFDARTGETITTTARTASIRRARQAVRGDFSIELFAADDIRVCDAQTGTPLWALPSGIAPYHFQFTTDGSHVLVPYRSQLGVQFACWKSATGAVIQPLPAGAETSPRAFASHDQRFGVVSEERGLGAFPPEFVRLVNGAGLGWSGRIDLHGESLLVIDYRSNRRYRVANKNVQPLMSPNGTGFAISTVEGTEYYEFPPRRNWWWLAGWCIAPPFLFRFVRAHRRAVKRRLRTSMPTFFRLPKQAAIGRQAGGTAGA